MVPMATRYVASFLNFFDPGLRLVAESWVGEAHPSKGRRSCYCKK